MACRCRRPVGHYIDCPDSPANAQLTIPLEDPPTTNQLELTVKALERSEKELSEVKEKLYNIRILVKALQNEVD
jgi:hypothetical protein